MTAQGWIVLGVVILAALYACRRAFRGLSGKKAGSCCEGCSGSCGEQIVRLKADGKKR